MHDQVNRQHKKTRDHYSSPKTSQMSLGMTYKASEEAMERLDKVYGTITYSFLNKHFVFTKDTRVQSECLIKKMLTLLGTNVKQDYAQMDVNTLDFHDGLISTFKGIVAHQDFLLGFKELALAVMLKVLYCNHSGTDIFERYTVDADDKLMITQALAWLISKYFHFFILNTMTAYN